MNCFKILFHPVVLSKISFAFSSGVVILRGSDKQNIVLGGVNLIHCRCAFLLFVNFVFVISSILHHHPALLRRYTLIMDRSLTFLVAFSILVSKDFFS